jgi:hypothetical protein
LTGEMIAYKSGDMMIPLTSRALRNRKECARSARHT